MLDITQIFDGTPPNTGAAITVTRASTNVLDLLVARDLGAGEILGLHVAVMQNFVGGTSLQVSFQVSPDTTDGDFVDLIQSPVIPIAQLVVGTPIFRYVLPLNQLLNATAGVLKAPGRYIRLHYTVVGTFSAGTVMSYLTPAEDRQEYWTYPNNYVSA